MRKISLSVLLIAGAFCGSYAQEINIDVKSNVHKISPYIYGSNEESDLATAYRWGGNRASAYNWENNASNGGNDASFASDAFFDYTGSTTPALPILNMAKTADSRNQYKIVTLQAAGYVAADKRGTVTADEVAPSPRWKAVSYHKNGELLMKPDTQDDTVYIDEMIHYLVKTLGKAGDGGIDAYAVDNEPYLWNQTHARMHPELTTYNELFEKTKTVASTVHKYAPGADVIGPMFYGWTDAYRWNMYEDFMGWYNINGAIGKKYMWFVDFYLDTLKQMSDNCGERLLDVIAFHLYPEARGKVTNKRIVNASANDAATSRELVADDMIEARLQAPRSLWDDKYKENSYVGNSKDSRGLIKKIKQSVETYFPGTKIAFTEFEYDAENHWSGGLTLVDVLGIFGREDVYLATKWNKFQPYSTAAYKLYLNYDGNGSKFGSTSVQAVQSDTVSLSGYASLDDDGNLHIIAINKSEEAKNTTFNIANGIYTNGVAYGFDQNSSEILALDAIGNVDGGFTYNLPARSAIHFILNAAEQTKLSSARIVEPNDSQIVLAFEDEVSLADKSAAKSEFSLQIDGAPVAIADVLAASNTVTLGLSQQIVPSNERILISYLGENLVGTGNLPVASFDTVYVTNELANASIKALSVSIDSIGDCVRMQFSKEIASVSDDAVVIEQNGENVAIDSIRIDATSSYRILMYPHNRVVRYHPALITNKDNLSIVGKDASVNADFSFTVEGGANYEPEIDSIKLLDNYHIVMYFGSNLLPATDYNSVGFTITEDGTKNIGYEAKYKPFNRQLIFTTKTPMESDRDYSLAYESAGLVQTLHYGVLESFNIDLENKMENKGVLVSVPGVIQADQYWYQVGNPICEEDDSDDSELGDGSVLGYTSMDAVYTYKISVAEEGAYTIYTRYAGERAGKIAFSVDGGAKQILELPRTGSFHTWQDAFRVVSLEQGEHVVEVHVLASGFNLNYFDIRKEETYPVTVITKVQVLTTGKQVNVIFDKEIEVTPAPEDITFIIGDTTEFHPVSFSYLNTKAKVQCQLDTTIYIGAKVSMRFVNNQMKTFEGGYAEDTLYASVINNSKVIPPSKPSIPDAVEDVAFNIVVAPNPVAAGQAIEISAPCETECSYEIVSVAGNTVKAGRFTSATTVSLPQSGLYFVTVKTDAGAATKEIMVR